MQKKTNLHLFKTVAITFFVVATLFTNSMAFGQNPSWQPIGVYVRVGFLNPSGGMSYVNAQVSSESCFHYSPGTLAAGHSWAGYTTSSGTELAHIRSGGLTYGFLRIINSVIHNVTASDVDAFWECAIFAGYDKISGASLSKNCHGHSTGVGYWLNDFGKLMKDDYQKYRGIGDLYAGAVYGNSGHSIKIVDVDITGTQYAITTHEKYSDSGIYGRNISPHPTDVGAALAGEVSLDLKTVQWNGTTTAPTSTSVVPSIDHFYKKK
ncbi:hypothetical protein FACS189443_6400 [Planctomycetales bacterium]|nr:hypothetical protein FACS189443_6400 [Planctomycetales bacterium]